MAAAPDHKFVKPGTRRTAGCSSSSTTPSGVAEEDELEELADRTLELAQRIAAVPTMAALLIKESVNRTVDDVGFYKPLNACFTLHQLNHSDWAGVRDDRVPLGDEAHGVPNWRDAPPVVLAEKNTVRSEA